MMESNLIQSSENGPEVKSKFIRDLFRNVAGLDYINSTVYDVSATACPGNW